MAFGEDSRQISWPSRGTAFAGTILSRKGNAAMPITETIIPASVVTPTARGVYSDQGPDPYEAAQGREQDLSFADFLDIINPLQHIPIINTIYREMTGDTISPVARMIGGGLFGGPIGLMASAFNNAVESQTGGDIGANLLAAVTGQDLNATAASSTQLAAAPVVGEGAAPVAQAAPAAVVPTIAAAAETAPQGLVPVTAEQAAASPQVASAAEALVMPAASGSQLAMQQALAAAQQTIYGAPRSAPITPAVMERVEAARRPASAPAVASAAPSREAPTLIAQAVPATASATTPAPAQVSDAMMKALDKYDAMVKARKSPGSVNAVS